MRRAESTAVRFLRKKRGNTAANTQCEALSVMLVRTAQCTASRSVKVTSVS